MSKRKYWFKAWIKMVEDEKIGPLPDTLWRRFFECIAIATEHDNAGYLPDDLAWIAWRLHLPGGAEQLEAELKEIESVTFRYASRNGKRAAIEHTENGWFLPAWAELQAPASAALRQKRYRQRKKELGEADYTKGLPTYDED